MWPLLRSQEALTSGEKMHPGDAQQSAMNVTLFLMLRKAMSFAQKPGLNRKARCLETVDFRDQNESDKPSDSSDINLF